MIRRSVMLAAVVLTGCGAPRVRAFDADLPVPQTAAGLDLVELTVEGNDE